MTAYRYLINRMLSLLLSTERRIAEWQKIRTITNNNSSPLHHIAKLRAQIQRKAQVNTASNENNKKNGPPFTYHSFKVRKITNLFKQTDIKIGFKSTNTLQQLTKPKNRNATQGHDKSGVHKLICKTRNKTYIGQTSRNLTLRYREHIRYIKKQQSPVRLCTAHPAEHKRISFPQKHHVTTQTNPQKLDTNSL